MSEYKDIDTVWGAKGAQWNGKKVREWIQQAVRGLIEKDNSLQNQINTIDSTIQDMSFPLLAANDGCYIVYHDGDDNSPMAEHYWAWNDKAQNGYVADGILVMVDGQEPIVLSLSEVKLPWSANNVLAEAIVTYSGEKLFNDFEGALRTKSAMSKSTELFGTADPRNSYAPAWCVNFSSTHTQSDVQLGISSGNWWMPSIGELIAIWKNKWAVKQCLQSIIGAVNLTEDWYASSSEASPSTVWCLNMSNGLIKAFGKTSVERNVRAVAKYIK